MAKPPPQHWLIKSEPAKYSYAQLEKDKKTVWDGVRNFEARNNLRAMKKGDLAAFPCGTGISHTFINHSDRDALLFVGGYYVFRSSDPAPVLGEALATKPGDAEVMARLASLYEAERMWPELLDNLRSQVEGEPDFGKIGRAHV